MIRLFLYLILIAGAAFGFAWIADRPGSLTVEWLGYEVRTSVLVGAILLIVAFAALGLVIWLGVSLGLAPGRLRRSLEAKKLRVGREALRRGLFAASAGDKTAALRAGAIAKRNLPDEPLALLLEAQSAQLNEDAIASRQAFERMLEKPELAEVGLRGLFIEAKKQNEIEAAKQFAERALTLNPALGWSSSALFDLKCREGDWRGALKSLSIAKNNKHITREDADKRRALLLTALASELEDTQQGKALAYAQEAIALDPKLIPASIVAGRILAAQGQVGRATKLIAKAWELGQHPELALIYAHARTGDSPRDRLARIRTLVSSAKKTLTSDIALAVAAIEAKEWQTAREALQPYIFDNPPAEVCLLMARIEAGQHRDKGRAREWLARAGRGAPSPTWVAPDGMVSSEWHPMTNGGVLGGYEWKTPPSATADQLTDVVPEMALLDVQEIEAHDIEHDTDEDGASTSGTAPGLEKRSGANAQASEATIIEETPRTDVTRTTETSVSLPAVLNTGVATLHEYVDDTPSETRNTEGASFAHRVFAQGHAPDDPGPRNFDSDDAATSPIITIRKRS